MTAAKRRIALVAPKGETQIALAAYLRSSGFDVFECHELGVPSAFGAIVVISEHTMSNEELVEDVRSWMKSTRTQRVVVVTSKPSALKELVAIHGERLRVMPAPAFGWELVDTLRASEPTRPRGA